MRPPYKKLLNALFKAILFWAVLHLLILVLIAIKNRDISVLNIFHILQVNLLFPFPADGLLSNIVSPVVLAAVYALFLTITIR